MVYKRRDVAACLDSVSILFFNAASRLLFDLVNESAADVTD
ncbi:hypothetical protein MES4922_10297 [Mesorhizobium ventifaucium]|uniref:Uncharacterized protein n=1 Tax=Mesorhizobium ventifaucium TaxID=666020 RepID=A0ABN8JCD7_9HYPH|nr:hypothetical protein MES4922_10297 [Mesorhizobium ventifaucium]